MLNFHFREKKVWLNTWLRIKENNPDIYINNFCQLINLLIYLFIFDLFNVTIKITLFSFGNESKFPRRVTTTSNLRCKQNNMAFQCKHCKLLTPEIRGRSQLMALLKGNPNLSISINFFQFLSTLNF